MRILSYDFIRHIEEKFVFPGEEDRKGNKTVSADGRKADEMADSHDGNSLTQTEDAGYGIDEVREIAAGSDRGYQSHQAGDRRGYPCSSAKSSVENSGKY